MARLHIQLAVGATLGEMGLGQGGYKIARSLLDEGCVVETICIGAGGAALPVETLRPIGGERVGQALYRALLYTPARFRPDMMLAFGNNYFDLLAARQVRSCDLFYGYSDQTLFAMQRARRLGALAVLHAANTHISAMRRVVAQEFARWGAGAPPIGALMEAKVRREYVEADAIRVQSRLVYQSLLEAGIPERKLLLVPPTVDTQRFRPPPKAPSGPFRVVFVGSFDLRKGLPYLLRAWDDAALPGAELVLHGGGGSRFVKRLLAPYRERPDVVFRAGSPEHSYHEASVVVVPSIEDGFAYVVLEALASGAPVIVSEQVGGKDAVDEGRNGWVVPSRDAGAIAERLRWLYDHPAQRDAMAQCARRTAERYDLAGHGRALRQAFEQLIAGRPCRAPLEITS